MSGNYINMYLFTPGSSGSLLSMQSTSTFSEWGLLSSCGTLAVHCVAQLVVEAQLQIVGFNSCCTWARYLWHMGQGVPRYVEFSQIRDETCVPCIGRWNLYHQAPTEVLVFIHKLDKSCK